jgi:subtilisin family serine protease
MSLRFDHVLTPGEIAALLLRGVRIKTVRGAAVRIGTVYSATVEWGAMKGLAGVSGLLRAEPAWRPFIARPLDISIPDVGADTAWRTNAPAGGGLDGTGVIIADVDTGVEYMHPAFFFADGGEFDWLDVDNDGHFTPGVDAVDLNGNGVKDDGETLNYVATSTRNLQKVTPPDGQFNPGLDWLYNDANDNGQRDMGPPDFNEDSPGFGEPILVTRDNQGKTGLAPGQKLYMLRTSKVLAIRDPYGNVSRRGTNLLEASPDTIGHGTGAASSAMGSSMGMKYVGVAPGAQLIAIDNQDQSFDFVSAYYFARDEGASVILHEYSNWIFTHMDGTSNEEQAINSLAAEGIFHSIPAGNLTGAMKHATATAAAGADATIDMGGTGSYAAAYASFHFLNASPDDVALTLKDVALPVDGSQVVIADDIAMASGDVSTGGTYRVDVYIMPSSASYIAGGAWPMKVTNQGKTPLVIHAFATDPESGWGKGFGFLKPDERYTVTWPSNAADGISVASYNTRYAPTGSLSSFSGRGPRIDGLPNVKIAAPGGYDLLAPGSMTSSMGDIPFASYCWFGGTSGAGPHVAGALAILKQAVPSATAGQATEWMTGGARRDGKTGQDLPDNYWGYGKLDIPGMLLKAGYDGGMIDSGFDAGPQDSGPDAADAGPADSGETPDAASQDAPGPNPGGGGCTCSAVRL